MHGKKFNLYYFPDSSFFTILEPPWSPHSLSRREPARPRMTVMGFRGSVQNCSSTGEKASRLLSSWGQSRGEVQSSVRLSGVSQPSTLT